MKSLAVAAAVVIVKVTGGDNFSRRRDLHRLEGATCMSLTVYEQGQLVTYVPVYVPQPTPPVDDTPSVGSVIGALAVGALALVVIGALLGSSDNR
jgi:hypothetical protein